MKFHKYDRKFENDCLRIFDSNVDPYFDPAEKNHFLACLRDDREMQHYYVVEGSEVGIIACGGFVKANSDEIVLSWGMVERSFHGKGVGKALLEYRLELISQKFPKIQIRTDTSQHTEGFFKRHGFETRKVERDAFGPGIDRVTMVRAQT